MEWWEYVIIIPCGLCIGTLCLLLEKRNVATWIRVAVFVGACVLLGWLMEFWWGAILVALITFGAVYFYVKTIPLEERAKMRQAKEKLALKKQEKQLAQLMTRSKFEVNRQYLFANGSKVFIGNDMRVIVAMGGKVKTFFPNIIADVKSEYYVLGLKTLEEGVLTSSLMPVMKIYIFLSNTKKPLVVDTALDKVPDDKLDEFKTTIQTCVSDLLASVENYEEMIALRNTVKIKR